MLFEWLRTRRQRRAWKKLGKSKISSCATHTYTNNSQIFQCTKSINALVTQKFKRRILPMMKF